MNEVTTEELNTAEYWTRKIEVEGIDAIEGIFSHDRTVEGADIERARNKAVEKYRNPGIVAKIKSMISGTK